MPNTPMKIFATKGKQVLHIEEDRIVYQNDQDNLEESWENFCNIQNTEIEIQQEEKIKDLDLFRIINLSRIELETGYHVYDILDKDVLELVEVKKSREASYAKTLKLKCIRDIKQIIDNSISILKNSYQKEKNLWLKLRNHTNFYKHEFSDRGLKIFYPSGDFILMTYEGNIEEPKDYLLGNHLCCIIKYQDFTFKGCIHDDLIYDDKIGNIKKFLLDKKVIQSYEFGDININILWDKFEEKDDICIYVLKCLKKGLDIADIFGKIQYYLCICFGKMVMNGCDFFEGIAENRNKVFYHIKDNNILETKIKANGKIIFTFNGKDKSLKMLMKKNNTF